MDRQTDRPTDRQTDRPTDRQTDRPTDRQADRQTDRQTDRQADNVVHREVTLPPKNWNALHDMNMTSRKNELTFPLVVN